MRCRLTAIFLLLSTLLLGCAAGAQEPKIPSPAKQMTPQLPTPPAKTETDAAKPADFSQEAVVVEKLHATYSFENDGSGYRELYVRARVQSEAGVQQLGQVVFGYNTANERVEIPYVRVLKADGSKVTAPADNVQDLAIPLQKEAPMYTDFRQKHVTVPGLRPGDVLEYDIRSVITTPMAPGQFWMEHDFAKDGIVLDEQLELSIPKDRAIKLKTAKGHDPKIADEGGRKVYRWTSSHLEKDDGDETKKAKAQARLHPDPPAVQMTTFSSWEEVGKWYGSLEKDRRAPSPDIKAKADALTTGKKTDLEKIEALYDFVGPNFRYVSLSLGLGRYQPHAASDVLHNEYGDCKDKNTLLASLLEAAGFSSSSVLIHSTRKLDPDVPSPAQFDHVITMVPLGKEEVWMDTTAEVAPFRLLAYQLRKKQALVIPKDGPAHLEETPSDPPKPDLQVQTIDARLSEYGKLDAHVSYTMQGDVELFARTIFRHVPNAKWQQVVKQMNQVMGLDGEVSEVKITEPAATHEPFVMDYKIAVANFIDVGQKRDDLALPLSQILLPEAPDQSKDKNSKSADKSEQPPDPIQLDGPAEFDYTIRLELPTKASARLPLPFTMKRDYASYTAEYKLDGKTFEGTRKLSLAQRELALDRSNDYSAFRRAVMQDTLQKISLDNVTATSAASADLKGSELEEAAGAAMKRGDVKGAIDLYSRVTVSDPKNKTAWLELGRAYMAMRQTDKAVEAFRHQTENDPYDEQGFSSLAWAYTTDHKYDLAADALNKALEINPLSEYSHSALGHIYSEQKQYDKAAQELEKAVSLKPENSAFQISLGDAYLNLGQDDKAMAAFDRAVEISPNSETWNGIAYQLSLKGSHLDRAQQYAESAVSAVSADLRNVTLPQLSNRQLPLVSALFSYWDTLGWVYYAKGDFVNAYRYVNAAWQVGQHGEVGDHLGQILEKQGKKEEAKQAYAMALSGIRPIVETRKRLGDLAGTDKVNSLIDANRLKLQELRTVHIGPASKAEGSAEFFVMLVPGQNGASVEDAKFISGDEKMAMMVDALRQARFGLTAPNDTPVKIFRRGVLTCSKVSGCIFVMMLPDDVRSVN